MPLAIIEDLFLLNNKRTTCDDGKEPTNIDEKQFKEPSNIDEKQFKETRYNRYECRYCIFF
mgnify:CR=1 FL=1|tara:strand:- start:2227 stop:2409 length:183 start_codon:yes stop_codon:yes gene_type:complete